MTSTSQATSWLTAYRSNLTRLNAVQKPARGTPAYSRAVNRPLGRVVAAVGHTWGLTANQATAISALLSAGGLVLLAVAAPGLLPAVAVPVLLAAGYVMDSVDGQLARLRGRPSLSGEWLDHTVDSFKSCGLHLAVLVAWYLHPPIESPYILLAPLLYEMVDVVMYFGVIVMPTLRSKAAPRRSPDNPDATAPWRKWVLLPTDYGFVCWVFVLLAWPVAFTFAYVALCVVNAGLLGLAMRKWWRELKAIDEAH